MNDSDAFDELVEAVRRTFFALRTVSTEMIEDLDCTVPERGILKELDDEGARSVPVLAEARGVSRQAMQKAVDGLIERGLLAALPNPRHQRSSLLAPTPAGQKLLAKVRARERRLLAGITLPVSDAELRRTTRTLGELNKVLSSLGLEGKAGKGG